jgi:hypothetical protein
MDRAALVQVWNEIIVSVFLERFLLVVCAAAFYGIVISNTMQIDIQYRIGIGLTLLGIAYILGHAVYTTNHPNKTAVSASTDGSPDQKDKSQPIQEKIPAEQQIFLPDDITPEYLCGLYRDKTEMQGDALAAPYQGKWMKFSGSVQNVRQIEDKFVVMLWIIEGEIDGRCTFDKRWSDQVTVLKVGSSVKAIGKVRFINRHGMDFNDCEF